MAGFADLERLSHYEIQTLLCEVDAKDGAVALKGASDAVNAKFLGNMCDRVRGSIKEEMECLGTTAPARIIGMAILVLISSALRAMP